KIDPMKLVLREDGRWGIEDGIHRVAVSQERGMTHVPAVTTEFLQPGQSPWAPRAAAEAVAEAAPVAGGPYRGHGAAGAVDSVADSYARRVAGDNAEM